MHCTITLLHNGCPAGDLTPHVAALELRPQQPADLALTLSSETPGMAPIIDYIRDEIAVAIAQTRQTYTITRVDLALVDADASYRLHLKAR